MLKIRRPLRRLIFNMGIAIPGKTVFLIETAPWSLIHWGRDKMADISQTTFSNVFSSMNIDWFSIDITLKFVPKSSINISPAMFRIMAWRRPGDKPLSETMQVSLRTHICVTRPQWVNTCSQRYLSRTNPDVTTRVFIFYDTSSSKKIVTYSSFIVNTMAADHLATQIARGMRY